ncbi:MAG: hypothetical protein WCJ30_04395 [Deltaproteobacteria bacterium]
MREPAVTSGSRGPRVATVVGLLGVLGVLGSCRPPLTQMLVMLDTDIPTCQLADIHLRCGYNWDATTADSGLTCDYPFHRGASSAEIQLPGSLGFAANERLPNDPLTLVIDDSNGPIPTLRRTVRVHFVTQQTTRLLIRLAGACLVRSGVTASHPCPTGLTTCTLSQSCEVTGPDLTCGNDGTCRSIDVLDSELEYGADAGLPDSSANDVTRCNVDASATDAGTDAPDVGGP